MVLSETSLGLGEGTCKDFKITNEYQLCSLTLHLLLADVFLQLLKKIMSEIQWPWQYNFPPFFTLQPNEETRKKQLDAWRSLVLEYHKSSKSCILDVQEADGSPLFFNAVISRKLSPEGINAVLEFLQKNGNAEPLDKTKVRWLILWHTLAEWADIIYQHAQENGLVNSVCTFYELVNTPDKEFTGLSQEVLIKVLEKLQDDEKAELIISNDISGVKFF